MTFVSFVLCLFLSFLLIYFISLIRFFHSICRLLIYYAFLIFIFLFSSSFCRNRIIHSLLISFNSLLIFYSSFLPFPSFFLFRLFSIFPLSLSASYFLPFLFSVFPASLSHLRSLSLLFLPFVLSSCVLRRIFSASQRNYTVRFPHIVLYMCLASEKHGS